MNHAAIYAIYPNVARIDDSIGAIDKDGNIVEIDETVIAAWTDPMKYARSRAAEYPAIGDQLDALWKGGEAAQAMLEQVMAVKTRHPKPE